MSSVSFTEKCIWSFNQSSPAKTYYIHKAITTTNNPNYTPSCSQKLCDITYDNNKITVIMGGGKKVCIPITITNSCPSIIVKIPNDTFSVVDSIDSECSNDSIVSDSATTSDFHPNWEIITETRTCVLGYFLIGGNPNSNGPMPNIGGCIRCPGSSQSGDQCAPLCDRECGYGNCGASGDGSRPWHVYIGRTEVAFPVETSNAEVNALLGSQWRSNMKQLFDNIAACKNTIPGNIPNEELLLNDPRVYSVNDIVEGIVPGTCKLGSATLEYDATMYRATDTGAISAATKVYVEVAYYTYDYRRPKNIQDILKTEEITKKCNEKSSQCDTSLRITSNYKNISCNNTPSCYDTSTTKCPDDQYCCRANKIEFL